MDYGILVQEPLFSSVPATFSLQKGTEHVRTENSAFLYVVHFKEMWTYKLCSFMLPCTSFIM